MDTQRSPNCLAPELDSTFYSYLTYHLLFSVKLLQDSVPCSSNICGSILHNYCFRLRFNHGILRQKQWETRHLLEHLRPPKCKNNFSSMHLQTIHTHQGPEVWISRASTSTLSCTSLASSLCMQQFQMLVRNTTDKAKVKKVIPVYPICCKGPRSNLRFQAIKLYFQQCVFNCVFLDITQHLLQMFSEVTKHSDVLPFSNVSRFIHFNTIFNKTRDSSKNG